MMYLAATVFPAPLSPLTDRNGKHPEAVTFSRNEASSFGSSKKDTSRLPDDDTLVLAVNHHVPVHVVSQGVDVGGVLILSLEERSGGGAGLNKSHSQHVMTICVKFHLCEDQILTVRSFALQGIVGYWAHEERVGRVVCTVFRYCT